MLLFLSDLCILLFSVCPLIFSRVWLFGVFFFFKQKTAYEMRISDWSSDVCSSDLTDWSCGVAWMNGGGRMPQAISDAYGFSVSNVAPCGPYVLAHEIGHNLGSAHDRETMSASGHLDYGVYQYSFGYRQDGPPAFATVMAYAAGERPGPGPFSSPRPPPCGAACGVQI